MSDEAQGFDHYAAVLADLKAKREQIDQAIKVLEGLRSGGPVPPLGVSGQGSPNASVDGPGAYLGMTIPEAAKKLLTSRKQTLNNADIANALMAGGLGLQSADPVNTVGSVLTRRFNQVGDIVKMGRGIWGLAEWYPGRNFKRKNGAKSETNPDEDFDGPSAPAQPQ